MRGRPRAQHQRLTRDEEMIAWIALFLPVGSAYTRAGPQTVCEYFSQASFNLTRAFSLDPEPDAKRPTVGGYGGGVHIQQNPLV
jgi:hypothetical protein